MTQRPKQVLIASTIIILLVYNINFNFVFSEARTAGIFSISSQGTIVYENSARPLHIEGPQIKDDLNNVIYLRGTNKYGFEGQPAGGWWMGKWFKDYSDWNLEDVRSELDLMKSWGINTVRFGQAIDQWKLNLGEHRQIIKELLLEMEKRDMYMIYSFFLITGGDGGKIHGSLPYPPYQDSDGTHIIANEQDFVNVWESVASELKEYPNVIFELWNEPSSGVWSEFVTGDAFPSWASTSQRCVDVIRSVGAEQPIVIQWWMGVWTNLAIESIDYINTRNLDWVFMMNITDTKSNIIYSAHMYRYHFAFHYRYPGETTKIMAWNKDDILLAFNRYRFEEVASQYPLLIGEIGCDLDVADNNPLEGYDIELQHELTAFNNCLEIFNERGYHYLVWWWAPIHRYRLFQGTHIEPDYTPTNSAQIFINDLL